jgi:hypothetical protein
MCINTQTFDPRQNCQLIIDSFIRSWNLQGETVNSSGGYLSEEAKHYRRKSSFCRIYQKELIDEILANNIELNPGKVERFLNYKFDFVLRSILFSRKSHK